MARILVVDDEERMVKVLQGILTKEGFSVLTAYNGEDCLKIAKNELPNLILLDVVMPGMDGAEVCASLQEDAKTANIPVIFLTGLIGEEEIIENKGLIGGHLYLSKLSSIAEIVKRINDVLAGRKSGG